MQLTDERDRLRNLGILRDKPTPRTPKVGDRVDVRNYGIVTITAIDGGDVTLTDVSGKVSHTNMAYLRRNN